MTNCWGRASSWESISGRPDLSRSVSSYLTDCAVPPWRISSWEKPGWVSRVALQEVPSGHPDGSYVSISVFHSWEDQARSWSTLGSLPKRSFHKLLMVKWSEAFIRSICFIVFEHVQQSFLMRRLDVWGSAINIIHHVDLPLRFLTSVNDNKSPRHLANVRVYLLLQKTGKRKRYETNHINNKCNNMNTRKMHITWAWSQARTLSHSFMSCHMHLVAQVWVSSHVIHVHVRLFEFSSPIFYFDMSFTVLSFFFPLLHFELHTELDNLIAMQNLRISANKGSNDAYDFHTSLTSYEPNFMAFSELNDSSDSFSYIHRHRTKTWMTWHSASCSPRHTENTPITAIQKVCPSVSRRCLLCSIEQGNLWEKEMSISQLVLVSRETRTVLTVSFLKTPKLRNWSIKQGILSIETAQMHRLGPYLMNRDKLLSQSIARTSVITNPKQLMPKKNAEIYEKNYGDSKWIFVKFQRYTFDTIASRKLIEDQNTILELSGRVQELQNEVNCMNDSKDFQDAEAVRSGNSHVTNQPMLFPKHPIPEGMLRPSFVSPQRRAAMHLGHTWYIGKRFCKSRGRHRRLLILKNWIHGVQQLRSRFICPQRRKVKDQNKIVSQRFRHLQWRRQFKELCMEQTNNDCRFLISTLTSSLRQQPLLAGT